VEAPLKIGNDPQLASQAVFFTMKTFVGGVGKAVITPPVGYHMGAWGLRKGRSTGIHRDLFARTVVIGARNNLFAFISLDICGMCKSVWTSLEKKIITISGIPSSNIIVNSTHNHTAPDFLTRLPVELQTYSEILGDVVAGTVRTALESIRPVTLKYGTGDFPGWTVNRQYPNSDIDTELMVLSVENSDNSPLAKIINFACHGVSDGGQYLTWSGDFSGELSASMEVSHPGTVALFLQGAAGDIHPFDWWFGNDNSNHFHSHDDTHEFGTMLAKKSLEISHDSKEINTPYIKSLTSKITLPRRKVKWTVDEAERNHVALKQKLGEYTGSTWKNGTNTAMAAEMHPELYGNGTNELRLAKNQTNPGIEITIKALRIGDIRISAHPGELFNELGSEIKNSSDSPIMVVSYCDDYVGYISTRAPYNMIDSTPIEDIVNMKKFRRYYGTTTSPFSAESGDLLVEESERINRLI